MDCRPLFQSITHSDDLTPDGVVDNHGRPALRSSSGRWTAGLFIIAVEVAERFAFYGVQANLISYLTGPLQQSTADAATAVNTWTGVAQMLPLLGGYVADSYSGRYNTIVAATLLYILGLGMLTASSVLPFSLPSDTGTSSPSTFRVACFYISLCILAFAQGGHKPCLQAFAADQFNQNDPKECLERSTFLNWWLFGLSGGVLVAMVVLSYIQDNVGWGLGFGIPCFVMVGTLVIFLLGTKTYRFYPLKHESPYARISKTFPCLAMRNQESIENAYENTESRQSRSSSSTKRDGLNRVVINNEDNNGMVKLFPIWASCLFYGVILAQTSTLYTKQGRTLDRRIGFNLEVPPAALQGFLPFSTMVSVIIYDRTLVPIVRKITRHPSGITMLQRIGAGMAISLLSMLTAALVEMKRLKTATDFGLVDEPDATIPMSFWWLVPQIVLVGIANAFTMVGLQEFFYDQVPDALRSLGLAFYWSICGIGSFLSGFLISLIDNITRETGDSWFSNNLNRGHVDYFYWLLAGLIAISLLSYLYFARVYVYKMKTVTISS